MMVVAYLFATKTIVKSKYMDVSNWAQDLNLAAFSFNQEKKLPKNLITIK